MVFSPTTKATDDRIMMKSNNYIRSLDIFGIFWQKIKNLEEIVIFVFDIEVEKYLFTVCFSSNKLWKASEFARIVLNRQKMTSLEIETLNCFLSSDVKVVHLSWIFMRFFFGFVVKFPFGFSKFHQRIPWLVCDKLLYWNKLLPKLNYVLFLDNKR